MGAFSRLILRRFPPHSASSRRTPGPIPADVSGESGRGSSVVQR
jgi:hypothetical protein